MTTENFLINLIKLIMEKCKLSESAIGLTDIAVNVLFYDCLIQTELVSLENQTEYNNDKPNISIHTTYGIKLMLVLK